MVKDTMYSLEVRLHRIEERQNLLDDSSIDLQDEKAVTEQCLRICERAISSIQSLQHGQPALQRDTTQQSDGYLLDQFEAQLWTNRSLTGSRDKIAETMGRLRERLEYVTRNRGPDYESEMLRLREEISASKQCLEVCKEASDQLSNQKIHIIGEVVADEDCDQVVVTALADLFNVGKVKANKRSMQMVGSMPAESINQMSTARYNSRFGAKDSNLAAAQFDNVTDPLVVVEPRKADSTAAGSNQVKENTNSLRPETNYDRPFSNQVRKRRTEGEEGTKKNRQE